jgi:hypothetical protein
MKSLPEPTKMLLNLFSDACGTSVFPLLPELIVLTDDTTEYIFEGVKEAQPTFIRATKSSIMKRITNSFYRVEDYKSMSSM